MNRICDRLQLCIKRRGYTRKELYEALNISKSTFNRYINGLRTPSNDVLFDLGKLLDVPVFWLIYGTAPYPNFDFDQDIIILVTKLSQLEINDYLYEFKEPINVRDFRKAQGISYKKMRLKVKKCVIASEREESNEQI